MNANISTSDTTDTKKNSFSPKYNRTEFRSNELIVNYQETGVAWITDGTSRRCNSRGTDFRVPLYGT